MNNNFLLEPVGIVSRIAKDIKLLSTVKLMEEIPENIDENIIIDNAFFEKTRGYFKKLVYQINTSYKNECYDACALLIRKLVELMIEEVYENAGRVDEITFKESGQLFGLAMLITTVETDKHWKLNRSVIEGLNIIKEQGDKCAHNRRYNARKSDVEKVIPYLRDIFEELLYLAGIIK